MKCQKKGSRLSKKSINIFGIISLRQHHILAILQSNLMVRALYRRNGVVVRASSSRSVDLELIPIVESYQKTKKWYPQLPCLALGIQGMLWRTSRQVLLLCPWARHLMGRPTFMWKTGGLDTSEIGTPKRVRTSRPKYSDTIRFLVN